MGLRRQEINAVKYSDVDYINRTLSVERQLGKRLNRELYGVDEKPATKKELPLKTMSSRRILPIPDYVFEAILQERKVYERNVADAEADLEMMIIFAVHRWACQGARTFIGVIIRNFYRMPGCLISAGMI